jgi:TRAP-type mannitol/chloroaromatic compound transport system permease small subunit
MGKLQLLRLSEAIDRLNSRIGYVAAWAILAMALVQFSIILFRFLFGISSLWLHESLFYFHVALVLFTAAWTLRNDGHVRVDIFYSNASSRARAWIDLCGALALLSPFMIAVAWFALPYVARSWAILEGSREAGGLPLVFVLKSAILVFAAQMLLQGLSQAIRAGLALAGQKGSAAAVHS